MRKRLFVLLPFSPLTNFHDQHVGGAADDRISLSVQRYSRFMRWNAAHFIFSISCQQTKGKPLLSKLQFLRYAPFCASLWLGSVHIIGVRGVKSFAVVIMGSPLQSNHELLKITLSSPPPTMPVNIYVPLGGGGEEAYYPQTVVGTELWARVCVCVCVREMYEWSKNMLLTSVYGKTSITETLTLRYNTKHTL